MTFFPGILFFDLGGPGIMKMQRNFSRRGKDSYEENTFNSSLTTGHILLAVNLRYTNKFF